ncbi:MAG: DUF5684 domain-containing protein [Rikenellaceae bacterium]
MLILLFILALWLLPAVGLWVIFAKAGKPGWAAFIPIYNSITLLQIARKPIWWIFMFCIPLVQIYFAFALLDAIAKAYGKGTGFTLGLIFFPYIFLLILAFGDATYTQIEE